MSSARLPRQFLIAMSLLPENTEMEVFDLAGFLLFNQDVLDVQPPKTVKEFKAEIRKRTLLIASPGTIIQFQAS